MPTLTSIISAVKYFHSYIKQCGPCAWCSLWYILKYSITVNDYYYTELKISYFVLVWLVGEIQFGRISRAVGKFQ